MVIIHATTATTAAVTSHYYAATEAFAATSDGARSSRYWTMFLTAL